ncbi:hypothetical protein Sango_2095000 [Sesamum angolense]|uniref:Uncharacterized protein n=1 Tax=Sesamum angolense TaxID=2727404 RepID=A0AAE2BM14_9LAMI|nr:hypothetical protein Sango_2095000 [Sesamum angolense]
MFIVFLYHESWGRRLRCNSVDGLGLTPSNMIRLESSRSCEEVKQKILEICWNGNGIGKMSKNPLTLVMETNKFNGTNYNDWLRNQRIVLDFENQGYVLEKPLPTALPEGSSPEKRITIKKWLEDNRKVGSIILAPMTNDIQKQYDRLDDVPSIMLRTKEVYAVPDRHIKYAVKKAFFGTKMTEGSSVRSHGVKMLSVVLEDSRKTHVLNVILQSLSPSYDPFIINYNVNGLEKSIHELINMLVQYKITTHKYVPAVLVGEASTSKAKGKMVGC